MISEQAFRAFDPATVIPGLKQDPAVAYEYDFDWLGGAYHPVGPKLRRGDGVTRYYGKKSGPEALAILDLHVSREVWVDRDQEWETVLSSAARDQAMEIAEAIELPDLFCVDVTTCERLLQQAYPGETVQCFRTTVGTSFIVFGKSGLTIDVSLMQFEEWPMAQVAGVTLYHEGLVRKNCKDPKDAKEAIKMLQYPDMYFDSFDAM